MIQLIVLTPSEPPVLYRFDVERITVGRSRENHLFLRDGAVSRLHVEIEKTDKVWSVRDSGSRNGTLLNGRPVDRPERLNPGDKIHLGDTTLVFDIEAHEVPSESSQVSTLVQSWSGRGTGTLDEAPRMVGASKAIQDVMSFVSKVAPSEATVLITGENGTGKELVARLIHDLSPRAASPFAVINCPALPESLLEAELFGVEKGTATGVEPRPGRFESAQGGTLLLDEIGDMPLSAQAKILRVIEEKSFERIGGRVPIVVDVRILAATNHDLEADIEKGLFRRDLYHRLNTLSIKLPPLRRRSEDIPLLLEYFLSRTEKPRLKPSPEALRLLMDYPFPGNVRELERVAERAAVLSEGDKLLPGDLPDEVRLRRASKPGSATDDTELAERLYQEVTSGAASFWDAVHAPFLRREVSRAAVRALILRAYAEAGNSYSKMAGLLGAESEYRRLFNFLYNHDLRVKSDDDDR